MRRQSVRRQTVTHVPGMTRNPTVHNAAQLMHVGTHAVRMSNSSLRARHALREPALRIAVELSNWPGVYLSVANRIVEPVILETLVEIHIPVCTSNGVRPHCLFCLLFSLCSLEDT